MDPTGFATFLKFFLAHSIRHVGSLEDSFLGSVGEDNFGSAICQSKLFPQGVRTLLFGDDPCFRLAIEFSTHLLQLLFEVKSGTCCGCFVSAERCFSFVLFPFFGWKKEARPLKTAEKINDFVIGWLEGLPEILGHFDENSPSGRGNSVSMRDFSCRIASCKGSGSGAFSGKFIDFSELTSDVFRFFWVWCFQQNHPRDSMLAYPNFLFNSLKTKHAACDKSSNFFSNQSEFNKKKKRRHIRRLEHPAWATKVNPSYFPWNTVVS